MGDNIPAFYTLQIEEYNFVLESDIQYYECVNATS